MDSPGRPSPDGRSAEVSEHKIVLASLTAGSEAAVGGALSEVLGVPPDFGLQIAHSAPIVIISGLEPEQAQAVLDAMAPVKDSGGNLAISAASSGSMGELNWPAPPTVGGRGLATYVPGYVAPPPPPEPAPEPVAQHPATPPPAAATPAPSGAALQCPHCGGVIRVQFGVDAPRAGTGPLGGPALADVPDVQGQPVPARPPSGTAPRSGPMDLEDFEKGVGGGAPQVQPTGDDLLKQLDAALPANPGLRALELAPPATEAPMTPAPAKRPKQRPGTPRPGRGRQQGQGRRRRR
jgi:hypothetical protein